jgi:hypothetical protein
MLKQFKKFLQDNNITVDTIEAVVRDEAVKNGDDAIYTEAIIWVKTPEKYIMFYSGHNKWGDILRTVVDTAEKREDIHSYIGESELSDSFFDSEMSIEEIAWEIYSDTRLIIDRTIDTTNVTDNDIKYLFETYMKALDLYNKQKVG